MSAIIPLLAFVTVVLLIWALTVPGRESTEVRLRKHGYLPSSRHVADLEKPFSSRVVAPLIGNAAKLVAAVAPERMQRSTREKLERAQLKIKPTNFLLFTAILSLGLPLTIVYPALSAGRFGFREFIFGLTFLFLGVRLPDFWLSRKISRRQERIRKGLPDAMDLITICVEAGYGLDGALSKVAEKTEGPLSTELKKTLLEVNLGKPRSQALRDLAQRTKVPDLQSFIATVIQAEQMGVSIASILRVQSDSMRVKRRQVAEEAAMKAPVKMLFPLVFCILPALFVVVLGPAALKMISFFMGKGG